MSDYLCFVCLKRTVGRDGDVCGPCDVMKRQAEKYGRTGLPPVPLPRRDHYTEKRVFAETSPDYPLPAGARRIYTFVPSDTIRVDRWTIFTNLDTDDLILRKWESGGYPSFMGSGYVLSEYTGWEKPRTIELGTNLIIELENMGAGLGTVRFHLQGHMVSDMALRRSQDIGTWKKPKDANE